MKKIIFLVATFLMLSCSTSPKGNVVGEVNKNVNRETSSTAEHPNAAVCREVMTQSLIKAYELLVSSEILPANQKKKLSQYTNQYQLKCGGRIANSVGYSLERNSKVLSVESDFVSLTYFTESAYGAEKIKQYGLQPQFLMMNRMLVAFSAVIILDQVGDLNNNYDVFYKTLKALER